MELTNLELRLNDRACIIEAKRRVSALRDLPVASEEQLHELRKVQKFLQYQLCKDTIEGLPIGGDVKADLSAAIYRSFLAWVEER